MARKRKRSRVLRQIKKKDLVASLKLEGCAKCGTHYNLTFHHTKEKKHEISDMISRRGCSITKLKTELEFCIVLCRQCHDDVHAKEEL